MFASDPAPPAQATDMIARAVAALALIALAVIHVVDLPGTLGPTPLVGVGYLAIVTASILLGAALIARSHWLVWAASGAVAVSAMGGYILTRALSGGFLGDHHDVGNWHCPLGIAALSVESVVIMLAAGWIVWQVLLRPSQLSPPPAARRELEYAQHR